MSTPLAQAILTARKARGLTQPDLADAAGVSQVAISRYENGDRTPDEAVLEQIAVALGVTADLLLSADRMRGAMAVDAHMRRQKTAPATVWRRLEARLNMHRLHTRQLLDKVALNTDQIVPRYDPVDTRPEDAARFTRMQWRMPIGPVYDLIGWIEATGAIVIEEDFGNTRIDGLSQWIGDHPVIMLNLVSPTDRRRLTLAHELGHLCLHAIEVTEDMEHQANAFAAEFLMPADVIRPQLRNLTIGRLYDLKREWRVSMQALIERAYHLKVMTASQRTTLYRSFSSRGWRIREPLSDELPREQPRLASNIGSALRAQGLTPAEMARLAGYQPSEQERNPFQAPGPRLRTI